MFQERLLLHIHYLEIVFVENATSLNPLFKRLFLAMQIVVMENKKMENDPKPRRHMKVFQERLPLHFHYLKLVKFLFMRNEKVLYPLFKKILISMKLMEMENKRTLKSLKPLNPLLVLQREPPPHQIHLLKKVTKVNVQGINMPLIKLLLIMTNMENPHIRFRENSHVPFVVKPAPRIEEKRYQRLRNKPLRGGNLQYIK